MTTQVPPTDPQPPKKIRLWTILGPIALVAALSALLGIGLKIRPSGHASPNETHVRLEEGAPTPDFELHPLNSTKTLKIRDLGAKVTLVNFWATWCEPCMQEMQSLQKARDRFKTRGFEVVAISVDETPEKVVPAALKRMKIKDLPIYTDPEQKLSELFDVSALPLTLLLDRDGKILLVHPGEKDWDSIEIQEKLGRWLER